MDDILIYADTEEELERLTQKVLKKLRANDLFLKPEKCAFARQEIDYLGFIIREGLIKMDPAKLAGLRDWPIPKTVKQVRSFLGFGNFYRKFIKGYSNLAKPLNELLQKNVPFQWTLEADNAFNLLKKKFTEEPVLMMPDLDRPFQIESDASKYASGAVLTQMDSAGKRHPVCFLSKTFNPTERRYEIYDRELLGIVRALREWRHYLYGSPHQTQIYSDHLNLLYFRKPQKLNDRQRRWIPELAQFDYRLIHLPGTQMIQSDTLSRRPDLIPSDDDEPQEVTLLPKTRFIASLRLDEEGIYDATLRTQLIQAYPSDPLTQRILSSPDQKDPSLLSTEGWATHPTKEGILLTYRGCVYVPDDADLRREITRQYHDLPAAGHPGQQGTRAAIQKDYFWPGLTHFVNRYVQGCPHCQQFKINRRPTHPGLFPIEGSSEPRPYSQCSMDLITDLPPSKGFDTILVIVDQGLTKGVILVPCKKTLSSEQAGDLIFRNLLTRFGRPNKIISDRDPRFMADSFQQALTLMGIKSAPSTAFHPQTDGATERVNQEIEAYLSIFASVNPETWSDLLPLVEFTHNSRQHADRLHSPFELLYGYQPPAIPTALGETNLPAVQTRMRALEHARNEALAAHELARARMKARFPSSFRTFQKGEKVWLEAKNLKLPYLSKKIAPKRTGPFRISEVLSPVSYRLLLPTGWRIHNVFHSALLTPFKETDIHGPSYPSPIPDIIDGEEEFEIEGILKHKIRKGKTQFLIRWKNCPTTEDSWEPEENVAHAQDAVKEYWTRIKTHEGRRRKAPTTKSKKISSHHEGTPSQNRIYVARAAVINRKRPTTPKVPRQLPRIHQPLPTRVDRWLMRMKRPRPC
jgi:hypothetical protein